MKTVLDRPRDLEDLEAMPDDGNRYEVLDGAIVAPPRLVVEVLSPTGRNRDLSEKRRIYADGGRPGYWLVDPAVPALTVLRLVDGDYEEQATVTGGEAYETDEPFPNRIVPSDLLH